MNDELLEQLRQPFPPDAISWLPGATTKDKTKCMAMAYADLRAYQERLDELMGLDWSVRYTFWGDNRIACELTLYVGDALGRREGITRSSTGEMSAQDVKNEMGGTVAEAQAMKRACAMFGLGRYLYELPAAWVSFDSAASKISKEGQNELDNRYRTWYQKTVAASKKSTAPAQIERHVEPSTGEIVDAPDNPFEDVSFEKPKPAVLSDEQLQELNIVGRNFYGKEWDEQRHKLAQAISQGAAKSSKDLTPSQATRLINGIKKKAIDAANAQEPIATVA